jgi:signal peptidase I
MRRVLLSFVVAFGGVVFLAVALIALGAIHTYAIPSSAMEPTLHCARPSSGCEAAHRDRLLGVSWGVSYARGDIVAFETPPAARARCGSGGTYIKRIVGLPGERIQIRLVDGADVVLVDGRTLDESYVEPGRRSSDPTKTYTVPQDGYFLLGDNRASSCDSRVFGSVGESSLKARIVATYWPLGRFSFR